MNDRELKGIMGLCVRAGQAVFGEESCLKAIAAGQCGALLIDGAISPGSREKYERACRQSGVPLILLQEGLIGIATGRPGMAMAIRKGSFSERVTGGL